MKIYQEDNVSGMTIEGRKEFKSLIEAVKNNTIKAVVVSKWDRFSRSTEDLLSTRRLFAQQGALVITLDDTGETSAINQLQVELMASINQYYVHKIAEDTKAVLINKTSKGHSGGGVANYGYSFDQDNFLVMNPQEAAVVSHIYNLFELGYSYEAIISELKSKNIKTRKGNDFSRSMIHDILTNVKYRGVYRYNRQDRKQSTLPIKKFDEVWVEGGIKEPIIEKAQFERVQEIMGSRKGTRQDSEYLLTGSMTCKLCGTNMNGSSRSAGKGKPRKRHYICPKHEKRNGGTCGNKGVNADMIENQVKLLILDGLNKYVASEGFDYRVFDNTLESKKRLKKSLKTTIDNLQKSLDTSTDRLLEPGINQAVQKALEKKIEELTSEINENKKSLKMIEASIKKLSKVDKKKPIKLTEAILFHDDVMTKQLIRTVVNKIEVDNDDITITLFEK